MVLSDLAKQLKPYIQRWIDGVGAAFVRLAGSSGGQTVYGGTAANEDLTLEGTSHATKTTSYIILQPTGGNVGIGTPVPQSPLDVRGQSYFRLDSNAASPNVFTILNLDNTASTLHGVGFTGYVAQTGQSTALPLGKVVMGKEIEWTTTGSTNDSFMAFETKINGTLTERARLSSDGNLGVNTTAPVGKIDARQTSTTAAIPAARLEQGDVSEGFIDYVGTSAASAAGPISTWTVATIAGYVRCEINGAAYWMPFYNNPTS